VSHAQPFIVGVNTYLLYGPDGLEDRLSRPSRVWNRIPDTIRNRIIELALDEPELSPRELVFRFVDTQDYFICEASVCRLLKGQDLVNSPAFMVLKATYKFKDKTTRVNQMWQTVREAGAYPTLHILNH